MSLSNRLHVASENIIGPRKLSSSEATPIRNRRVFGEFSNFTSNKVRPGAAVPDKTNTLPKPSRTLPILDENYPVCVRPRKAEMSNPSLVSKKDLQPLKDTPAEPGDFCNRKEDDKLKEFFNSEYSMNLNKSPLQLGLFTPRNVNTSMDELNLSLVKEDSVNLLLDDFCLNLSNPDIVENRDAISDLDELLESFGEIDTFDRKAENPNSHFFNSVYDMDLGKPELEPEPLPNDLVEDLEKTLEAEIEEWNEVEYRSELDSCVDNLTQQLQTELESFDLSELLNM